MSTTCSTAIVLFERGFGAELHTQRIEGLASAATRISATSTKTSSMRLSWFEALLRVQSGATGGNLTPVFFGTALAGVGHLLDGFVDWAPKPQPRKPAMGTCSRAIRASADSFSDPGKQDRNTEIESRFCASARDATARACECAMCGWAKAMKVTDAVTFMAGDRQQAEVAYPGDIIGLHNHGTIGIGDTFTDKQEFRFNGIPNFAPELFGRSERATR